MHLKYCANESLKIITCPHCVGSHLWLINFCADLNCRKMFQSLLNATLKMDGRKVGLGFSTFNRKKWGLRFHKSIWFSRQMTSKSSAAIHDVVHSLWWGSFKDRYVLWYPSEISHCVQACSKTSKKRQYLTTKVQDGLSGKALYKKKTFGVPHFQ